MPSSVNANANAQETPRSSHLSPISSTATISPTWAPPKSPLPPHRLAKLANALGVSTPMPAVHQPASFMSRSYLESPGPTTEHFRRSPTPSTPASNFTAYSSYSPAISKYLLHVIPPLHLPHENDSNDIEMTQPPATASGYHTQFRRGTLVPVYATLQSQLGAIAKEYALPSTTGLIIYLVSSAKAPQNNQSPTPGMGLEDEMDEPGPRLSEDIWKHLWTRVLNAEQRDDTLMPSLTKNPLGMSLAAQSTPYLPHESNGQPLRPFLSSAAETTPLNGFPSHFPPSPSTPSTVSDLRSNAKSAPPSSSSVSEPETPDTSSAAASFHDPASRANSLDLPGLISPSIIPILAKVEFDIDRRKAPWYDPWLRSRRMNHAKRAESRNGGAYGRKGSLVADGGDNNSDDSRERPRHIDLLTGRKQSGSPVSLAISTAEENIDPEPEATPVGESLPIPSSPTYEQIPEPEDEDLPEQRVEELAEQESPGSVYEELPEPEDDRWSDEESEGEDEDEFESTARVLTLTGKTDPLADVFGTDAETWQELQTSSPRRASRRHTNPNVVELALDASDLTALPSPTQSEYSYLGKEEDEVQALLDEMSRPALSVSIPSSPQEKQALMSPEGKKHVPPPLVLMSGGGMQKERDMTLTTEPSPMASSASSTNLAYLGQSDDDDQPGSGGGLVEDPQEIERRENGEFEAEYKRVRSPDAEKRGGAVFDDLDLGLDPTEDYDSSDPHEPRRSQFIMKAQLDEIERTLAQLSPRVLHSDLEAEQTVYLTSASPNTSANLSPGGLNSDFFPPSPRLPQHPEIPKIRDSPGFQPQAAWPATPFAALKNASPPRGKDAPPSPPRLAVNGITTSAPRSYAPNIRTSGSEISSETESRRRELEEENGYSLPSPTMRTGVESPIIPLSPDPFGRFSSASIPSGSRGSSTYWENEIPAGSLPVPAIDHSELAPPDNRKRSNSAATSRFSADSITGVETNAKSGRTALITVDTIKRLWRKSNKNPSISNPPPTPSGSSFPSVPPPPRPSQDLEAPQKSGTFGRFSPQPGPPRQSQDMPPPAPRTPPPSQLPNPFGQMAMAPPPQFNGRSGNTQPIVAAQMRPSKSNPTLDRLQFDQESPYPMPRRSPSYTSSRAPSPPPLSPSPQTMNFPPTPAITNGSLPPASVAVAPLNQEKEKPSIRKSILKGWKSSSISQSNPSAQHQSQTGSEPRSSGERQSSGASRGRRPSILNFGSSRGSAVSPPLPSPQVPQQFNIRGNRTNPSIDSAESQNQANKTLNARETSPRRSMASTRSRDSRESRPSFDTSQFEIVSPKMNSTLSYPYHGLDHDP
ncbi:hypothetical protein H0H81_002018 [Sphagnurus paluster]|uniref:Uncharacterized protein n=1 Tax=Sphagnurus paluster TaxID=117069 RepID=A0A9P7KF23_9AGAR|nr:hypothetical protein H0H81_002018 [Sphagnurus paluster]